MIKQLVLALSFLHLTSITVLTATPTEAVSNDETFTNTQRFSLYAAIYLDQMTKTKEELLAHFRTDDTSDTDFILIADNALLANLIEIIENMTYEELHTDTVMSKLTQILSCKSLETEPSIQARKTYIIEILKEKKIVSA